jgi:hypothetical protein
VLQTLTASSHKKHQHANGNDEGAQGDDRRHKSRPALAPAPPFHFCEKLWGRRLIAPAIRCSHNELYQADYHGRSLNYIMILGISSICAAARKLLPA